jgi:hypothetical protein
MIGKAAVLSARGDRAAVRKLLERIDAALPRKPVLSDELKHDLELTRTEVSTALDAQ